MNYVEHRFSLDVHETVSQVSVRIKKRNTAHRLLIHLTERGCPFHISPECYAVFTARKPDGKVVFNDCTIEDCVIIYDFTPQTVAAVGLLDCEIKLYGADDALLTSSSFNIIVEDTVCDEDSEIDSETEATALTKLISEATTLITDVEEKLENGEFVGPQGPQGEDYVLTEDDKAEIAEMAAELVDVPGSGGNVDQSGGGLSTTAVNLLIDILSVGMFTTNVSGKIESLKEALLAGSSGDSGSGDDSGGSGEDSGGDDNTGGGETVTDDITVSDGIMTIVSVGSAITVSDGIMSIA